MKNLIVQQRPRITVNFPADQWELLSETEDQIAYRDSVALLLNGELMRLVNECQGYNKRDVEEKMLNAMKFESEYGAYDSEPRVLLEHALAEIFR